MSRGQRHIRCINNWRGERNSERLILRRALEDLLFAQIGIIWTGDGLFRLRGPGRRRRRKRGLRFSRQLRLIGLHGLRVSDKRCPDRQKDQS